MRYIILLYKKLKKIIPIPIKVFIKELIKTPIRFACRLWVSYQFSSGFHLRGATLSIVILTFNALPYTKKCIRSIQERTKQRFEVIIVDNASTDGTRAWLRKQKDIRLICNKENMGVAVGRNQGIKVAKNDYIVFLDNDVEVEEKWDKRLLSGFCFRNVAIVGASGGFVTSWHPLDFKSVFGSSLNKTVDYVSGWCFMFPRKLVDELGFLDERMGKFWHEDLEFCFRAKRNGYLIRQVSRVPVTHHEHKSQKGLVLTRQMPKRVKGFQENADYIVKKFLPYKEITIYRTEFDEKCESVLCMITSNITRLLRQRGWKVIRKKWLPAHTKEFSFLLCNPYVIDYQGINFTNVHQENDRPPSRWRNYFQKHFDYNLCSSKHCQEALLRGRFEREKLLLFPHGVDPDIFNPDRPIEKKLLPGIFKFLTVGASQPRKNTDSLIDIFCETFTQQDPVVLIVKDYDYGQRDWIKERIRKASMKRGSPKIIYYYGNWAHNELADLYRNVAEEGAFISMHHAECFGLPVLEAACCGCRIGVTGWGGSKDFIDGTLFPYTLSSSKFHYYEGFYEPGAQPLWAEPKRDAVQRWIKLVVSQKPNRVRLRQRAHKLLEGYSWDRVVDRLEGYLRHVDETSQGEFFGKDYWYGKEKSGYETYQECEVQENNARNLFEVFQLKGKKVLDLGSCFGYEVKQLNKLGVNAYGCDVSKYAVKHAYDVSRIRWADISERLPYGKEVFDFIYSLSTFEHLSAEKVEKALRLAKLALKNHGTIFLAVSTPNDPEFFDDKSHRVGESEEWWGDTIIKIFGNLDEQKAEEFYKRSREAQQWNWHIFVAHKK